MYKKKTERRVLKVRTEGVNTPRWSGGMPPSKIFGRNGAKFAFKKILGVISSLLSRPNNTFFSNKYLNISK